MVERPPQPADDDSAKAQQRHSLAWRLAVSGAGLLALGVLAILLLACVRWIPERMYPSLSDTDLYNVSDAAKVQEFKDARLKLQNEARTTLLQGLGGVLVLTGAAIGAGVTLRQIQETATANRKQLELSERGQVTDRYTKAIDQLDEKKALAVRLGGLYALERIARDSRDDRATIAEVLCTYARTTPRPKPPTQRAKDAPPPVADTAPAGAPAAEPPSLTVRAPDVQAAVTILGRWRDRLGEPPVLDLHDADLQGARLFSAQLQDANFEGAQLQDANFWGAQLQGAILDDAQLQGAILGGVQLQGAQLMRAQLQGANLLGAQLQYASLFAVQLQGASLVGAGLQGASLADARLQGASLADAQLEGAILDGAQLEGARASKATRWPNGWDHTRAKAAGVQFVDSSGYLISEEVEVRSSNEPAPSDEE
jgi:Pentapeptide repeats (8 copies)